MRYKFILILFLIFLPISTNESVKFKPSSNFHLVGRMELYINNDGYFIVNYNGIISPCFSKQYFDYYYPCDSFNIAEYLNELKQSLHDSTITPHSQKTTRKFYRL